MSIYFAKYVKILQDKDNISYSDITLLIFIFK